MLQADVHLVEWEISCRTVACALLVLWQCSETSLCVGAGWALHVQHQLLTLDWPTELLSHPVAAQEVVSTSAGDNILFRGLRVRMGINTGKPASIQVCSPSHSPRSSCHVAVHGDALPS